MVWPILISVSLAPGPYFFSASAEDEASARTDKIADKSRLSNLICIISLSCRSRWTDVAFRHDHHRVILYVSIRLATQTSQAPAFQSQQERPATPKQSPQLGCALCRTALAAAIISSSPGKAAKLVRILLSFHIRPLDHAFGVDKKLTVEL